MRTRIRTPRGESLGLWTAAFVRLPFAFGIVFPGDDFAGDATALGSGDAFVGDAAAFGVATFGDTTAASFGDAAFIGDAAAACGD